MAKVQETELKSIYPQEKLEILYISLSPVQYTHWKHALEKCNIYHLLCWLHVHVLCNFQTLKRIFSDRLLCCGWFCPSCIVDKLMIETKQNAITQFIVWEIILLCFCDSNFWDLINYKYLTFKKVSNHDYWLCYDIRAKYFESWILIDTFAKH